jgi:rare lipoprotein A
VVRVSYQNPSGYVAVSGRESAQRGFWPYVNARSLAQAKLSPRPSVAPTPNGDQFQVLVKGQLIAQMPTELPAKLMAQRLAEVLENPSLDPAQIQPAFDLGIPGGKLGDRLLFVVDEAITTDPNRSLELIAIEWVNNLRVALGASPLTLVEAQSKMYGLTETETKIPGFASWYGGYFHGRLTANGETFSQYELTAAHRELPFNTYLKVKNLKNGKSVIVRINDRGPYIPPRNLDLSRAAARCIDSEETGVVSFEATIMQPRSTDLPTDVTQSYLY